jgi:alkanesulfonate monooxygenase SsuD/methylene tetrahydromethanopterin reductase-like flavin-dependent oxidoreductase (luciferase family)
LKVGLIYDFRNPKPWRRPWDTLYEDLLSQIENTECLGFDEIWLTEHHFAEDGYLPSLFPVAAAIATRTRTLRIGTNALLATLHHPLRVAEDAAIVDILSRGRLDLGLTMGFRKVEFRQFDVEVDFNRRMARFKDVVHALRHAYGDTDLAQPVRPAPLQRPHPPIYVGAQAPSVLKALAPLGLPLILIGGADRLAIYRQAQSATGLDPSTIGAPIQSLGMFLYVAETREAAWDRVRPYARYAVEQDRIWSGKAAQQVTDDALKHFGLVGSPEDVANAIVQRVLESQPAQVCFFANPPGMPPELAMESLQLFATRVRPAVEAQLS